MLPLGCQIVLAFKVSHLSGPHYFYGLMWLDAELAGIRGLPAIPFELLLPLCEGSMR